MYYNTYNKFYKLKFNILLTKCNLSFIIAKSQVVMSLFGDVAQLARACGSYPQGQWFEPTHRHHLWSHGQSVKTPPFHGGVSSSILLGITNKKPY